MILVPKKLRSNASQPSCNHDLIREFAYPLGELALDIRQALKVFQDSRQLSPLFVVGVVQAEQLTLRLRDLLLLRRKPALPNRRVFARSAAHLRRARYLVERNQAGAQYRFLVCITVTFFVKQEAS